MSNNLQKFFIAFGILVCFTTQAVYSQCQVTINRTPGQNCTNGYFTLTADTSGTGRNVIFNWLINGQQIPGANSNTLIPAQAGSYIVIINSASCTNLTSASFVVGNLPDANFTFVPNNSCSGAAVQFTAAGNQTNNYHWNFADPSSGVANTSSLLNPSHSFVIFSISGIKKDSKTFSVSLSAMNADGCATVSQQVTVKDRPQITNNTISGNQTICTGTMPAILNGSAPGGGNGIYDFSWEMSTVSATAGFNRAPGNNTSASYQPMAPTQTSWFRRLVSSGGCVSASPTVEITVHQLIGNTISPNQEICLNATPAIITGDAPTGGNGNYIFLWETSISGPNSGFQLATGLNNSLNYAPGPLTQTTWYRRKVVSGPCPETWSPATKITVNPPIAANFISKPQVICHSTLPAPFTGSNPTGGNGTYTYLWEESTISSTTGFGPAAGANSAQNYSLAGSGLTQTTWYRRNVYSGGCSDASSAIQITVNPALTGNTISANQTICSNSVPVVLTGNMVSGGSGLYSFLWEISTDNVTYSSAPGLNTGLSYQPGSLTQTSWFRRQVSSGACAPENSLPVQITVNPKLGNNVISGQQEVCAGEVPAKLTGSLPSGGNGTYTYRWEMSFDSLSYTVATGLHSAIDYSPPALTKITFFRRMAASPVCDSIVSQAIKIKVKPLPAPPIVPSVKVCPGNAATLQVTSAGSLFRWFDQETGGNFLGDGKTFTVPVLKETITLYVEVIDQGCVSLRTPATILVPTLAADAGPDITVLSGKSILLRGSGGINYTWKPETGLSETRIATPIAKPLQTTTYTVTVVTPDGCQQSDSLLVTVLPHLKIPNGFTPNGDGINDTWEIPEIEKFPACEVTIFNRWGNIVYKCKGPYKPWDGHTREESLPVTTYFYSIKLLADEDIISGNVTIVK